MVPSGPEGYARRVDEAWGFIWIMLILKIPVVALLWIVWWAVHAEPEPGGQENGGDGGPGTERPHVPRPMPPAPRRRGDHGAPVPPSPARTRVGGRDRNPASAPDRG